VTSRAYLGVIAVSLVTSWAICSVCLSVTAEAQPQPVEFHDRGSAGSRGSAAEPIGLDALADLDYAKITSGILYDKVLPLSAVEDHDGSARTRTVLLQEWKQMYSEMSRASLSEPSWPALQVVLDGARSSAAKDIIPVAVMNFRYTRIRPDAFERGALTIQAGRLREGTGDAYADKQVFAAAALKDYTYRGASVVFDFSQAWYFTNDPVIPARIDVDFGDGLGLRAVGFGERSVAYRTAGRKVVEVRMYFQDGGMLRGSFPFDVRALETPAPDDTLAVTAAIPYNGQYGSGEAYVYLSDAHTTLANPVVVVEGFDFDNAMNWEELYALLNQQGLAESLRADGFDAVVLNFADATDYIQKNSFVVVALIQQVNAAIGPFGDLAVVGASMGGVAARYALAYMEANELEHKTRTLVSFDSPQKGADIPLGLQYWVKFFSSESEEAADMLAGLNAPAARQLLVYHLTDPPGTTGEPDPLRTGFLADLSAVGDYPASPRKVAVANGSGMRADQGFAAGDQIIFYEYNSFLVDIRGNVWAVPDGANQMILQGLIDRIWPLPDDQMNVSVSGTRPYDYAPGGWRASMVTMDTTQVPYGDIVALHPAHCFIPTISALALDTDDLFYDIAGDPDLLAHTPFDTLYYPAENQEHITITPESAVWLRAEIERGSVAGIGPDFKTPAEGVTLGQNAPNPFIASTVLRFSVSRSQRARLDIYNVAGQRVATLLDGLIGPGAQEMLWNGKDDRGGDVPCGVYFYRLAAEDACRVRRMVVLR
jgi:hypothetical protein